MTQATGGLIALVGVFIIFRIQIQRQRIQPYYDYFRGIFATADEYLPKKELKRRAREYLESRNNAALYSSVKNKYDMLVKDGDILKYTVQEGREIIIKIAILFCYYVLVLHINSIIYNLLFWKLLIFLVGLGFSFLVLFWVVCYLLNCIKPEEEYLCDE